MYIAVDILKAFACILIFNFHSVFVYPESLQILSFGGDLGNNIFFLVSGFSLAKSIANSKRNDMGKWAFKRYAKIVPICFVFCLIGYLTYTNREFVGGLFHCIVFPSIYWFTTAIAIFYPLIFLYNKLIINKKYKILIISVLILVHLVFDSIYTERYIIGFLAMIVGLELRLLIEENKLHIKPILCMNTSIGLFACYCALKLIYKTYPKSVIIHLSIGLTTILFAIVFLFLFIELETKITKFFNQHKYTYKLVVMLSSLTLYVYLCQQLINFTIVDYFNKFSFPISVIFYWTVVLSFSLMTQQIEINFRKVIKKNQ